MIEDINKFVWENVKRIRNSKNLTQEELANLLWIKRPRIAQIENWTQSPTLNSLKMISDWLWVDIKDLFLEHE